MDTSTSPKGHHFSRTEVRWQVYFFTSHSQIEGETVNISAEGALISCREMPPTEGNFRVVVKPPDHFPLDITGKLVWTTVCCATDGTESVGADIQFVSISDKDRQFLQNVYIKNFEAEVVHVDPMAQTQAGFPDEEEEKKPGPMNGPLNGPQIANIRLPVFYNKGGKTVKAVGSRFSTKGCHLYTKLSPPKGAVFSLQMKNPRTGKSIQVDSSVVQVKRCAVKEHWGMVIRFMNLTGSVREEIRQILHDATGAVRSENEPRYIKSKIGQSILKHFSRKRTVH
jgi:hypothetical protein